MTTHTEALDALEALAYAATPGPWFRPESVLARHVVKSYVHPSLLVGESRPSLRIEVDGPNWNPDAAYVAAADPTTVIALIAELRQERERADDLTNANADLIIQTGHAEDALSRAEEAIEKARHVLRSVYQRPRSYGAAALTILTDYDKQKED